MWASRSCPQVQEASQLKGDDYTPSEKKSKGSGFQATSTYDNSLLKEAVDSCRNQEMGIEEASIIYGIPKSTLRAKLKDSNSPVVDENFKVFVLSEYPKEAEADLVVHLQGCLASQITLSATEVRRLAYELVHEKYNANIILPKEKNGILGQKWYKKFVEKYPDLDVRSQTIKGNGAISVDFYNTLESFINRYKISDFQIYSVEGIELKFHASCVEDMKVFHKRRTIYTNAKAICCTNPVGDFLPPIFLKLNTNNSNRKFRKSDYPKFALDFQEEDFKQNERTTRYNKPNNVNSTNIPTPEDLLDVEKQIKKHVSKKLQPMSEEDEEELRGKLYDLFAQLKNKVISKSESSLNEISSEIFYNWFVGFINHVNPSPERKVLLLLSDQNYVKSFRILELGKKHGVVFLILPPHSAHRIYPLDGFALSLNRNLSTCARRWLGKNPDYKLQQVPLHVLFMEAFSESINPLIAKNGFLYSGIWPINRDVFESSELGGESTLYMNKSVMSNSCELSSDVQKNNLSIVGITNEADIGKLCRACMKEKMYMKPLLEEFPSPIPNYHGMKFSEIVGVPLSHGDDLPSFLCQYCLVQLIDTIKIRETAVKSHKKQIRLKEALDRMFFEDEERENQEFKRFFQWATTHINDSKLLNRIISKNFDINSVCRICMGEKPLMTSIFFRSRGGTMLFTDICGKIMKVSEFQIQVYDGLSSSICPFCRTSISKAAEFISKALSSDKILREIILHFKGGLKMEFKTEIL